MGMTINLYRKVDDTYFKYNILIYIDKVFRIIEQTTIISEKVEVAFFAVPNPISSEIKYMFKPTIKITFYKIR